MQAKRSVVIQQFMRRYLARKKYFKMREEAYDNMVLAKILLIQAVGRRYIARQKKKRFDFEQKVLMV